MLAILATAAGADASLEAAAPANTLTASID